MSERRREIGRRLLSLQADKLRGLLHSKASVREGVIISGIDAGEPYVEVSARLASIGGDAKWFVKKGTGGRGYVVMGRGHATLWSGRHEVVNLLADHVNKLTGGNDE